MLPICLFLYNKNMEDINEKIIKIMEENKCTSFQALYLLMYKEGKDVYRVQCKPCEK